MTQLDYQTSDFAYDAGLSAPDDGPSDCAGLPARIAIFGDRAAMRDQIEEDLAGAGFHTINGGSFAKLLDGPIALLGDAVMVDCPVVDAASLAALARLDMRAARSGAQLIVITSIDALNDVFSVLDQSDPQILVQPSRAERVLAVGRVMTNVSNARMREMTEEDRLGLLHLSRQVEAIAHKLEGLSGAPDAAMTQAALRAHSGGSHSGGSQAIGFADAEVFDSGNGQRFNSERPPLPKPRHVRQVIAGRQARAKFFEGELFADPAWDMLLDLTAAHAEQARVSVTSLCIAAAVPATTALRWIKQLVDSGVFVRVADSSDRRRAFIALSEQSTDAMARYFAEVETPIAHAA
jgi:hypothetical protein